MTVVGLAIATVSALLVGVFCVVLAIRERESWLWRLGLFLVALLNFFSVIGIMQRLVAC